jgi:hypothetical protein
VVTDLLRREVFWVLAGVGAFFVVVLPRASSGLEAIVGGAIIGVSLIVAAVIRSRWGGRCSL